MSWLVPFAPVGDRPVVVCLPQAGSGCGVFRPWQAVAGDAVTVVGVQLPGRESRFTDPPAESFAAAVAEVVAALTALGDRPTVLFGHSLGGLLGYEVARALPRPPEALVVAASRPPHRSGAAADSMGAGGADAMFARLLAEKDLDEDMRELAMEVFTLDSALSATYVDPGGAPVGCPLHAWGGEADEVVTGEDLEGWRRYAGGSFHPRRFPGGHDFCLTSPELVATLFSLSWQGV